MNYIAKVKQDHVLMGGEHNSQALKNRIADIDHQIAKLEVEYMKTKLRK